jgi:hypothetical protein
LTSNTDAHPADFVGHLLPQGEKGRADAASLRALRQGRRPGRALHYQPIVAEREAPAGTRPWLRRTVG